MMTRSTIWFVAGLLALIAAFAAKGALVALPAVPEAAESGQFDTARAYARLERVLAGEQPHPIDSPASDAVRERLLAEMRAAGLQPRVADSTSCFDYGRSRSINCARVRNLVATIGPADGEHLLITAHYDSVAAGPGAADAGVGIASLLEVAEQLRGRQLARPVTFLLNEGEESGLLGARTFLEQDPAAPRVAALINLEARGVTGPAIMFETNRPNGAAIDLYAGAVKRPVANSLSTDFYRLLPNSTDVAVFGERPWTILNVAIIGNETRYHSAGDSLAALDLRSLHHMGSQTLQLASRYTSGEELGGAGSELIYADVLGMHLIAMPLLAGLVLLAALLLLLGFVTVRRRAYGRPLLACSAAVIGAGLLGWAGTSGVQLLRAGEYWRAYPLATQVAIGAAALLAIVLGLTLARRSTREQLRAACWFLYTLIGAAICFVAPGAAIFFLLAPLVALAGILIERRLPGAERAAGWLAAVIQLLTLLPVMALIELLLSTSPGWVVAPLAALAALPVLIEVRPEGGAGRTASIAALAVAAAAWTAVLLVPAYSADRQQIFTIEHVRDTGSGQAQWAIYNDGAPLPEFFHGIGEWRRDTLIHARRPRWVLPAAPQQSSISPTLIRLGERPVEGGRLVSFQIALNGWDGVVLNASPEAQLRTMSVNGTARRFGEGNNPSERYLVRCSGRSCDGLRFDLLVGSTQPVEAILIGSLARLPPEAEPLLRNRPEHARPQYLPDASIALTPVRL